jgi:hypothetical protein
MDGENMKEKFLLAPSSDKLPKRRQKGKHKEDRRIYG